MTIHAEAVDAQGNLDVADADITVTVDTLPADLIGAITIPEDLNGDGILNADELGTNGTFNASGVGTRCNRWHSGECERY